MGIDSQRGGVYEKQMTNSKPDIVVILAAGLGSRLRAEEGLPKPLMSVRGRPLILRVLDRFFEAGVDEAVVVLGHRAGEIESALTAEPLGVRLSFAFNDKYELSNGLSVLAARDIVGERPFFLSMSDHIFDTAIIQGLAGAPLPEGGLILAVDRKLDTIYDMDDATKVATLDGRIVRIGKQLPTFDAVDSGLFSCSPALFEAILEKSRSRGDGDCSLSEGVETLARGGLARVYDIGDGRWQDVDTPECLAHAEEVFSR
jgi:1L-myo-inositol 1-phosphate cytidylyltransferase